MKFTATYKNHTATRNSKSKVYTHVTMVEREDGSEIWANGWASSKELAEKNAAAVSSKIDFPAHVHVVAVN